MMNVKLKIKPMKICVAYIRVISVPEFKKQNMQIYQLRFSQIRLIENEKQIISNKCP